MTKRISKIPFIIDETGGGEGNSEIDYEPFANCRKKQTCRAADGLADAEVIPSE